MSENIGSISHELLEDLNGAAEMGKDFAVDEDKKGIVNIDARHKDDTWCKTYITIMCISILFITLILNIYLFKKILSDNLQTRNTK